MRKVTQLALPVIYVHSQAIFRQARQPGGSPTGTLGKRGTARSRAKHSRHSHGVPGQVPSWSPQKPSPKWLPSWCLSPPWQMTSVALPYLVLGPSSASSAATASFSCLSPAPQGSQHTGPCCPSMFTPRMNLEGQDPSQLTSPGTPAS